MNSKAKAAKSVDKIGIDSNGGKVLRNKKEWTA